MKSLKDKVVVITGAGSGIGRALALNLADKGALLALSDVDEDGPGRDRRPRREGGRPEVRSDRLDVADRDAFAGVRRQRSPSSSAGSTWSSTTPASRWPATSSTSR